MSSAPGRLSAAVLAIAIAAAPGAWAKAAVLRICAAGHAGLGIGPDPLAHGPLDVPRGAAFRFSGGRLHLSRAGRGEDAGRRHGAEDVAGGAALVIEEPATLSKGRRCAAVPVAALVSARSGWSASTVRGERGALLRPYGVVERGHLDLTCRGAGRAFRRAAIRGEIDATLAGETRRTVHLKRRRLHVIPRHRETARSKL